jgi:hypothetical protein
MCLKDWTHYINFKLILIIAVSVHKLKLWVIHSRNMDPITAALKY